MAMAIPFIGMALSAVSSVMAGNEAKHAAAQTAAQDLQSAGEVRASSQRAAIDEGVKSKYIQSRALAVAGASGAGASDPTVLNTIGQIAGEGEYRAMTQLYEGNSRANAYINDANAATAKGKDAASASVISAAATIASEGSSMYSKYGEQPKQSVSYNQTPAYGVNGDYGPGQNMQGYSPGTPGYVTDYRKSIFGRQWGGYG